MWLEIAQARGDRVALSKALEALEGAVGSDDSSEALTLFGRALLLTSDEETAERMLQDATQKTPVESARLLLPGGRRRAARPLRRRPPGAARLRRPCAATADARRRSAQSVRLGDLSLKLNEPAVAATYFLRAADGADATLLARAADAQLRAGDKDAARATVAKALEKDPQNLLAQTVYRRAIR